MMIITYKITFFNIFCFFIRLHQLKAAIDSTFCVKYLQEKNFDDKL